MKKLKDNENEAYMWIEQESSVMVKVASTFGDPLELTSEECRELARLLIESADELDSFDK